MTGLEQKLQTAKNSFRARLLFGAFGGMFVLLVALPLVYFTHSVAFRITPQSAAGQAAVSLSGGIGWVIADTAYLLGKRATLRVASPGFISQAVAIDFAQQNAGLMIAMQPAPVDVEISTEPPLPQTRWRIDGVYAATAARFMQALPPGAVSIEVNNAFYRAETLQLNLQIGEAVSRHLQLTPVSGNLSIDSEPPGARLLLNGESKGVTPLQLSLPGGLYRTQVMLQGYQQLEEQIAVTNVLTDIKRNYRLKVRQAAVRVTATPTGGIVRVNGVITAAAPSRNAISLALAAGETHTLRYEKPGYIAQSRQVKLQPKQQVEMAFRLQTELGEVVIRSAPSADIVINGNATGNTPQSVRLQTVPQNISLQRAGYRTRELRVTPRANERLLIDEQLVTESAARLATATPFLTAPAGIKMKFFDPRIASKNRFTMGAPRSDKFRRANEFQRQVNLTKPFYVSTTEITEQQFAKYQSIATTGNNLPARNVSWLDAAGFCNWLSAQDGLQPAYSFANQQLHSFNRSADGYRLLSEAEWEWLARVAGSTGQSRFVWGDATTIPNNSGNFADESSKGSAAKYIARYNDGFAGVAAVASFPADAAGLYDLAGNVSEWVHDIYDLQPPTAGQVETNPFGRRHGEYRVIKGASFRSASVTSLRASFREGLLHGRDDVGFRIARYLYGGSNRP